MYDYDGLRRAVSREVIASRPPTIWRYREFLPVGTEEVVTIQEGFTPRIRARNLGREFGFSTIACASTGNLANAVAAYGARAGLSTYVFIPENLEVNKVMASHVYEPHIIKVRGSYDDVNRLCTEVAGRYPWAFVNINVRPFYAEGSKTLGFEVVEQLGWRTPDHVVVPVASGSLLTKVWKAFHEFKKVGLIGQVTTRVHGAQAAGCAPVATAWANKTDVIKPVKPNTIAKSLAIGNPADGYYALKVMAESGGLASAVSEEAIVEGMKLLARTEGIFAETAGGVTIAALKKLVEQGVIQREETVVAYVTGTGLKTAEVMEGSLKASVTVDPSLASFEASQSDSRQPTAVNSRRHLLW